MTVGQMTEIDEMSCWPNVCHPKDFGEMFVDQMLVDQMSVGQMPVNQMYVNQMYVD